MREGDTLYWLLTDHLGSTAVTTWSGGSRSAEVRYMPFGLERYKAGSQKTDYRFTGQRIEDSLDLYFYNARWYDPVVGRFIQADTVVPEAGNPQSLNRYAYVNNNPLRYTDPSGHWLETVWDIVNIGWDIHEVYRDPGNGWNWVALAVDVGAAALPAVPAGAGLVVRGGKAAKAAAELASHADEVADVARVVAEAASHADKAVDALRAVGQVVGEAADVLRGVENATEAVRETSSLPRRFSR
ncbi:MAG: RHS repeat-associated core domain-containing protein, partial [Candidatus Methanomethyliaceae archaeon]